MARAADRLAARHHVETSALALEAGGAEGGDRPLEPVAAPLEAAEDALARDDGPVRDERGRTQLLQHARVHGGETVRQLVMDAPHDRVGCRGHAHRREMWHGLEAHGSSSREKPPSRPAAVREERMAELDYAQPSLSLWLMWLAAAEMPSTTSP